MNKKLNTVFFVLGATLFNVIITVAAFILLIMIYARYIMDIVPDGVNEWSFPVCCIAAIAISFVVYRAVLNFLIKKINMDQYFDPIFGGRCRH